MNNSMSVKLARYQFAGARLDLNGRVLATCNHRHGRRDAEAITCARKHGWDGFLELLLSDAEAPRPLEVWRFWSKGGTTYLRSLT